LKVIFLEYFAVLIKGTLSYYLMGFKKTQKTPKKEIEKAIKLMKEYFKLKKGERL
jgi:phage-related protein